MSPPAGSINRQGLCSGLDLAPSFSRRLCVILESSLIATSARRLMFNRLSLAGLQSCAYVVSDDLFHRPSIPLLPLCCRGQTTEMLLWLACPPAYSVISSPFSIPQLGQSLVFGARIASPTLLSVFTGPEHHRASSLTWQSLSPGLSTARRFDICLLRNVAHLPTNVDFGRPLPDFSTSVLHDYTHCR